jgi:hypothetical protein
MPDIQLLMLSTWSGWRMLIGRAAVLLAVNGIISTTTGSVKDCGVGYGCLLPGWGFILK